MVFHFLSIVGERPPCANLQGQPPLPLAVLLGIAAATVWGWKHADENISFNESSIGEQVRPRRPVAPRGDANRVGDLSSGERMAFVLLQSREGKTLSTCHP